MVLVTPSHIEEPFACPIGVALWLEYRKRNPDALAVPPECQRIALTLNWLNTSNTSMAAMIATRSECFAASRKWNSV
jgi:hypothetical protein